MLNELQKKFIALAIFSMAMKVGPTCFLSVEDIIDKIGIRQEFEFYAKDWVEYSKSKNEQKEKVNG